MLICFTSLSMAEQISLPPSTSNRSHMGDHGGRMCKPAVTTSRILQWEPYGSKVQWALTHGGTSSLWATPPRVLTLGFASMFSRRSHSSLRVYLAFPVMASMEPLLICCLMAQISRKNGSPTVSWGKREKSMSATDLAVHPGQALYKPPGLQRLGGASFLLKVLSEVLFVLPGLPLRSMGVRPLCSLWLWEAALILLIPQQSPDCSKRERSESTMLFSCDNS